MAWDNACQACGRHRNSCTCTDRKDERAPIRPVAPEAHWQGVSDEDFRRLQRARRDFVRRVEDAIETGDQSDIDKRIDRWIDPVAR